MTFDAKFIKDFPRILITIARSPFEFIPVFTNNSPTGETPDRYHHAMLTSAV
jgi:hypothetical protein